MGSGTKVGNKTAFGGADGFFSLSTLFGPITAKVVARSLTGRIYQGLAKVLVFNLSALFQLKFMISCNMLQSL